MGDKKLLDKNNIPNVIEFNWWDEVKQGELLFTFTPVQHWSARGLFDKNKSLWGGWFFKTPSTTFFHAGDSGYSKDFKLINKKLGGPDVAFIPIGAYDPEWFMSASHMNPEEAIQASNDLGAKINYAMHWGTFVLTSEDTLEPPQRIRAESLRLKKSNFKIVMPGQVSFFIN
jgi:N-acyl-phosphatidylethanolamine-hydrolysing phospholipase D